MRELGCERGQIQRISYGSMVKILMPQDGVGEQDVGCEEVGVGGCSPVVIYCSIVAIS